MRLTISHTTHFDYDRQVQPQLHLLYLRPRENPLLHVKNFQLLVTPAATVQWMRDDLDNLPARVEFSSLTTSLEFVSISSVETSDIPPFEFLLRDYAMVFPFAYESLHRFNLGIYLTPPAESTRVGLRRWVSEHFKDQPKDSVAWLLALTQRVFASLTYTRRDEPGIQTPLETLECKSGTCRDYASLLIELARMHGLAARFVSGYLYDAQLDGGNGTDMHAWVEVFLPGAGWRGLDPTHGLFCDNTYVPVAHAVVAESVNPVQGSFSSPVLAAAQMTARVQVLRTD